METHQSSPRESFRLPLPSLLQTKVSKAVLHRHTNANTLDSQSPRCNTCLTKHHCRNDTSCRKTSFNGPLPSVKLNTRLFGTYPQPWEDSSQCYTCSHKTRYKRWTNSQFPVPSRWYVCTVPNVLSSYRRWTSIHLDCEYYSSPQFGMAQANINLRVRSGATNHIAAIKARICVGSLTIIKLLEYWQFCSIISYHIQCLIIRSDCSFSQILVECY